MLGRFKLVLLAAIAVCGLFFAMNAKTVRADDKKKCDTCAEVKSVLESMRCDGCKGKDKACGECEKHIKSAEEKMACHACAKGPCADCEKAMKDAKCKPCAAKAFILAHTFCCAKCEKAGAEKAAACDNCKKQKDSMASHMKKCEACEKK